jgi:peroxiredoxin
MKFILLILVLFCTQSYAQIFSNTTSERIEGKVYYKNTGQKISDEELIKIITNNPGIAFERIYNKYGKLEKLYYDPDGVHDSLPPVHSRENQIKTGEKFPEFVFKTVDKEILDSEKLLGKWILLRFEVFTKFINRDEIDSISYQIKESQIGEHLVAILCLADSKQNINKEFDANRLAFKLVPDARNFHKMFKIVNFPTSILIDREGKVFKYYYLGDTIPFEELMRK